MIDLEFSVNRQDLIYEREYNLNTKPLVIDPLKLHAMDTMEISVPYGEGNTEAPVQKFKKIGERSCKMVQFCYNWGIRKGAFIHGR